MYIIAFLCVCCGAVFFLKLSKSKYRKLASPGPCLPVLGHSYLLFKKSVLEDPANGIWKLYRNHNRDGILHMNTFSLNTVWIGDYKKIKYLFNLPEVTARLNKTMLELALPSRRVQGPEMPGILFSDGQTWHQQRRFTLRTLRDFGFGKQGMEELIQEEIVQFKNLLDRSLNEPVDFMNKLTLPILNALWNVTGGERFDYDNPRLKDLVVRMTETFKILGDPSQALLAAFPWLAKVFPGLFNFDYATKCLVDVSDMMEENILKHKETLDANAPRDFIDMMLIEIENTTDPGSSFHGQLGLDNLKVTMFDLFIAGSETTSTTLTWAALYMVRYPGVQARVQQELDTVVGINRWGYMQQ